MSMSPEHVTKKRRSSGIAIIGMSWLTMTLGLFFATLAGSLSALLVLLNGWFISPKLLSLLVSSCPYYSSFEDTSI